MSTMPMISSDETGKNRTQWQPGQSGNPSGRPKGARSKLSEAFLQAFAEDFERYGKEVIEKVRTERPHDYLKVIATVTTGTRPRLTVPVQRDRYRRKWADEDEEYVNWKGLAVGHTQKTYKLAVL